MSNIYVMIVLIDEIHNIINFLKIRYFITLIFFVLIDNLLETLTNIIFNKLKHNYSRRVSYLFSV